MPWRLTSDAVAVDPITPTVTASLPFSDLSLFSKLTSWGTYLHMGIMFGLPLQILLLASAVAIAVMIGAGYAMWFKRRPTRIPGRHLPAAVRRDPGAVYRRRPVENETPLERESSGVGPSLRPEGRKSS